MSGDNIAQWLIHIQGKNISESILQSIKDELGVIPTSKEKLGVIPTSKEKLGVIPTSKEKLGIITTSKKLLYDYIVGIINKNGYTVDPKYVYENILGLHIPPVDLATENIILTEFEVIRGLVGDAKMRQVPNAYILQKISEKYDLNIGNTVEFPLDRKRHYDIILYLYTQAS